MFGEVALGASNVVNLHGVAWDQPADLSSRAVQEKLSPVAIRAFFRLTSHWKLRDEDARGLIGGISNGSFYQLKRGATKTRTQNFRRQDFRSGQAHTRIPAGGHL